jgi:hypothetical protein
LIPCSSRKKYFTITLWSIRSIQIFITHFNIYQMPIKRSSEPDSMDRFFRWTHMIHSKFDLVRGCYSAIDNSQSRER